MDYTILTSTPSDHLNSFPSSSLHIYTLVSTTTAFSHDRFTADDDALERNELFRMTSKIKFCTSDQEYVLRINQIFYAKVHNKMINGDTNISPNEIIASKISCQVPPFLHFDINSSIHNQCVKSG